jgi:LDH2 family malate/lactate/ureidoglycolate dehydrogenase
MTVVQSAKLTGLYEDIARKLGASAEEADIFARCLVRADLRGMYTQGAAIVPYFVYLIENRIMRFGAPFTVIRDEPATALVDGGHGVGSVVSTRAMDLAILKAKSAGVGCVWVRNGGDFAMTSNHALQALEHDHVGIAMRNGSPRVAPWGGRDAFFGTNPISVAIPSMRETPIVIDMASGSFSVGKVIMAARDGQLLPSRHLVTEQGIYTDDPRSIIVDPSDRESAFSGAIVSLGYKGYAWLLVIELLAGLLSGMGTSNRNDYEPSAEHPWNEGIFLMSIDVGKLQPAAHFKEAADQLFRSLKSVRPAEGCEEVMVPGEAEAERERRYAKEGIPIRDEDWKAVAGIARRLGMKGPL